MNEPNWYRKAWEGIWNEANDEESTMLEALAIRAGLYWQCACGYNNVSDDHKACENCGGKRDE